MHSRFGLHVVEVLERKAGQPRYDDVRGAVALTLRQQAWTNALRQYLQLLAGAALPCWRVDIEGAPNPVGAVNLPKPATMPDDELLNRLRRFNEDAFPQYREQFKSLVEDGQRPTTLFIGCSDSRLVPYLLTGAGPGELFVVRNVGAFVPALRRLHGLHGTAAAIKFAVLSERQPHRGLRAQPLRAIKTLCYGDVPPEAQNLSRWLELGREATLPVVPAPRPQAAPSSASRRGAAAGAAHGLPMVRRRGRGSITLHGWHYVIEDGEVHVFDVLAAGSSSVAATSSGTDLPPAR